MAEKYHKERKAPKKISKTYLENAALYYLQRYATSAENLKRVLMRKIKRSCAFHEQSPEDFTGLVDELVARYTAAGLLNDLVFAAGRVASLRRQGGSKQAIIAKLQAKGLGRMDIETALGDTDDLTAAQAFVKRKRLLAKDGKKALAALGRAGFSYETARTALAIKDED